jgi:hypothetical protein
MTNNFTSNALIQSVIEENEEKILKNLCFLGCVDEKNMCAYDYAKLTKNPKIIDLIEQYECNTYDQKQ